MADVAELDLREFCICGQPYYGDHDNSKDVWDPAPPLCPFCGGPSEQTSCWSHPFDYFICGNCEPYEIGFTHTRWWRETDRARIKGNMPDTTPTEIIVWQHLVWGPDEVQGDWDHSEDVCMASYTKLSGGVTNTARGTRRATRRRRSL